VQDDLNKTCFALITKYRTLFAVASVPDPMATVQYEMMSDGLMWSDELPGLEGLDFRDIVLLRVLWNHRARLVCGEPGDQYRDVWEQAKLGFPTWMGFARERCAPSAELAELFRKKQSRAARLIRRMPG
jgi:hypothetical protein